MRPVSDDRTKVNVTGETGRRFTVGLWQVIGETLAHDPDSSEIEASTLGRWGAARRTGKRWARAHPWEVSAVVGIAVFALSAAQGTSSLGSDLAGSVLLAVLIVVAMARILRLWPDNRLIIHWHAVRIPPMN